MAKTELKKVKLVFFATVLYSILFWVFLALALLAYLMGITGEVNAGFLVAGIVLTAFSILMRILREVRRKGLSKKLTIITQNIPYDENDIKHYMGWKENDNFQEEYLALCKSFKKLRKSKMCEMVMTEDSGSIGRMEINDITTLKTKLEFEKCPLVDYNYKVPYLLNGLGHIFYLFPHFVLKVAGRKEIIAFPYSELGLEYYKTGYVLDYEEKVPNDTKILGTVYEHSNKNGTADQRYADNPERTKIEVGDLVSEEFGINYMFSNSSNVKQFYEDYLAFAQKSVTSVVVKQQLNAAATQIHDEISNAAKADNQEEREEALGKVALLEEDVIKSTKKAVKKATANPYEELKSLIGLDSVKAEIETLANLVKVQKAREKEGLKNSTMSYHLVFTGNPGTGKTTIARIIAQIYAELGILKQGHLVETDRSGLVAEYLGQTAVKTNKIIDEAIDGVLFIDEAYTLTDENDSYGKEAVATLLKRMEDDRDRLVVILAGYTENMKTFISSNPGLESRFNRYIDFPDYSEEELLQIFMSNANKFDYIVEDGALQKIKETIHKEVECKDNQFGNARFIRNMFENILANQANRLANGTSLNNTNLRIITDSDCKIS